MKLHVFEKHSHFKRLFHCIAAEKIITFMINDEFEQGLFVCKKKH